MSAPQANAGAFDPRSSAFYREALATLHGAGLPFLVGGAYAFGRYTGIVRDTKDFDIFVRERDARRVLAEFARVGYRTEMTFPHWLGKVFHGVNFVDVIFGSGNGVAMVDDEWFEHARAGQVVDVPVQLAPPEEMIWQKSLVQERERYDGADVAHLLRACAEDIDWDRLLHRFGPNWRVLLSHIVLFGFIYPGERDRIPKRVVRHLLRLFEHELDTPAVDERICRGTILSRAQYLVDIDHWGYADARLRPAGGMSEEEVDHWTAGIQR
ncbi:MAG TPA: hypothetical protein VMM18_11460 [Gemmatimonadaceae bacterium]|nr:hypothetical protein [Gemmatimonadaceae bacterium]